MDNQTENKSANTDIRREPEYQTERAETNQNHDTETSAQVLSAGQWARRVLGFDAPFGHDGLPTVWG